MKKHNERPAEPEQASGAEVDPQAEAAAGAPSDALSEATRERDDYLARWQRAQADFQNLRRRTLADIDAAVRRSQQSLLEGILLSIDQLELALGAPHSGPEVAAFVRGVEMTRSELLRTLAQAGVKPLELEPGRRFDPALHQAVATVAVARGEPGTIVEVVRRGYSWGDVVLRPAQVIVAGAAEAGEDAETA